MAGRGKASDAFRAGSVQSCVLSSNLHDGLHGLLLILLGVNLRHSRAVMAKDDAASIPNSFRSSANVPGSKRKDEPQWEAGDRYTTCSYRRAIQRGCDLAFPPPEPLARLAGETIAAWRKRLTATSQTSFRPKFNVAPWRQALADSVSADDVAHVTQKLLEAAKAGGRWALREFFWTANAGDLMSNSLGSG